MHIVHAQCIEHFDLITTEEKSLWYKQIKSNDINNFYKSFQIKKNHRKKIDQIEFDFIYNFSKGKYRFDNVKIDKNSNEKVDEFIEEYNSSEKGFPNKITFKNFVKNLFSVYAG